MIDREAVERTLQNAVDKKLTPGAAAAVVVADEAEATRFCVGAHFYADSVSFPPDVSPDTIYDLASLTKLLCTTRLIAQAVDDGVVALDEQPFSSWPGVTVAHLLQHTSGLAAHRPLHEVAIKAGVVGLTRGKELIVEECLRTVPDAAPGERTLYSDLGFIALGAVLEKKKGQPLSKQKASAAAFVSLPDEGLHARLLSCAPTERCPWRRRAVHGQVHDENAYAMGGVAGHAGLFGSLKDVEADARFFLSALRSSSPSTSTLRMFAEVKGDRGYGFDKASKGGATGDVMSARAVGHLGFTGTSLWLDPEEAVAFVLLANTVHPSRENVLPRNKALRRAFHRAVKLGEVAEFNEF